MTAGAAGPLAGPAGREDRPVPYWPTDKGLRAIAEGSAAQANALAAARRAADEYEAIGTPAGADPAGVRHQRADACHLALLSLLHAFGGDIQETT